MGKHKMMLNLASLVVAAACLSVAASAFGGILYSSGFESSEGFSLGTIHGQNSWQVVGDPDAGDIVNLSGNWVLRISSPEGTGYGGEVQRSYDTHSTLRYVVIEMDFMISTDGRVFWFMDNVDITPYGPDCLYWQGSGWDNLGAYSNANPGIDEMPWVAEQWYHFGIEIDTLGPEGRYITAINHNGVWKAENDTSSYTASYLYRFVFRGYDGLDGNQRAHLYIDNLLIRESDEQQPLGGNAPVPEPAGSVLICVGVSLLIRRRR